MIYVIHGTDTVKARAKWHAVIDSLIAKRPEANVFAISGETGTIGALEELLVGQTLFSQKYIVAGDHVLANPDLLTIVKSRLKEIAAAEHIFVLLEGSLDKKLVTSLEKQAFKVVEFDKAAAKKATSFNIFALTDALGARDRRNLWLLYQQALREEVSEEEIFWKLTWQLKNILLVKGAAKPDKLGLHPYALQKTRGHADNYSTAELLKLFWELTELYHEARRGKVDFDIRLEQIILSV